MSETMETHEHAEEAAKDGRRHTALLIAVLAAGLAFCEQGAQHADTHMTEDAVAATDVWAQYQAKSVRSNQSKGFLDFAAVLPGVAQADRDTLTARLKGDIARFETDPKDGKAALADKAHALERERDAAHARLEAFDNAAAALQLGIVLTTASVITGSLLLAGGGALIGIAGGILAVLGLFRPDLAAL
jgi:tellurite resistance protein